MGFEDGKASNNVAQDWKDAIKLVVRAEIAENAKASYASGVEDGRGEAFSEVKADKARVGRVSLTEVELADKRMASYNAGFENGKAVQFRDDQRSAIKEASGCESNLDLIVAKRVNAILDAYSETWDAFIDGKIRQKFLHVMDLHDRDPNRNMTEAFNRIWKESGVSQAASQADARAKERSD